MQLSGDVKPSCKISEDIKNNEKDNASKSGIIKWNEQIDLHIAVIKNYVKMINNFYQIK